MIHFRSNSAILLLAVMVNISRDSVSDIISVISPLLLSPFGTKAFQIEGIGMNLSIKGSIYFGGASLNREQNFYSRLLPLFKEEGK